MTSFIDLLNPRQRIKLACQDLGSNTHRLEVAAHLIANPTIDIGDVEVIALDDGVDVAQGSTTDPAASTGTVEDTTARTSVGLFKGIKNLLKLINDKLVSGTDIGDVTVNNAAGDGVYVQPGTAITFPVSIAAAPALVASEAHIGEVGGKATTIDVTPTLTVAGAYVAGDYIGTSGAVEALANAVRVSGGTGQIQSVVLIDKALQSLPLELWLFDTDVTPPADNAAWSISDADAATCIGVIPLSSYYASALNSVCVASGLGIAFKAVGTSIWCALVSRGAGTWADGDLTVRLSIFQD